MKPLYSSRQFIIPSNFKRFMNSFYIKPFILRHFEISLYLERPTFRLSGDNNLPAITDGPLLIFIYQAIFHSFIITKQPICILCERSNFTAFVFSNKRVQFNCTIAVSYTHLTLPTKRIV